ncbi:hypothetical protein PC128_g17703 [Phytophthora cactorum]|nr:hypothetical protein PC128_g17703 [Phytophthora cactorum]
MQPPSADLRNAMYNGWLHAGFVTGTICFAADGCIIWSKLKCRGSRNGSNTSLGFRNKLLHPSYCPDQLMNVVSDSAFPCSTAMTGRILTPLKGGHIERILPSLRSYARTLHNAITSVRQAAEWGMRSVQKVYSRLNLPLSRNPWRAHLQPLPDGELPSSYRGDVTDSYDFQRRHGGAFDAVMASSDLGIQRPSTYRICTSAICR